ncbi:T9SS type A sorting domain-containing protein [Flavobacteriaceae bacterium]|nr:T9SS type A sorting domain-containing protein [Flavobacteriaceae bacterium]
MRNLLLLLLFVFCSTFSYSQSWDYFGNSGFSNGISNNLSLGIDLPSGNIWLALQDISDAGKLNIYSNDNTSGWINDSSGLSDGYANNIDLSVDINGNPYYSFIDGNSDYIGFGYLDNSSLWREKNPSNGGNNIGSHSINSITKEDTDGNVFICSYHTSWKIVIYRASQIGGNFSIDHSYGQLGDNNISQISFDIKYNTGLIAYSNLDDGGKIDVLKFNGDTFSVNETYDNISGGLSNYFKLVINPFTFQPYIAYQDIANGGGVTVKKLNDDTWGLVGQQAFSDGLANYVDLAFDVNGVPYVAFQDVSFSNKLSVMTYNGTTWEYVGERGVSPASASYCSIELDSDGEIFVAFKDGSVSNKASVLRFGAALSIDDNDLNNYVLSPNPANDKLTIDGVSDYDAKIYNNLGQFVMETTNTNTIDVSTLSKGIYFIKVSDGINSSTKKFIKN